MMPRKKITKRTVYFVIEGEFITDTARQMWGVERNPDKGMRLLQSAFPDMPIEMQISILTGYKKLVGDSSTGIQVVDDTKGDSGKSLFDTLQFYQDKINKLEIELEFERGFTTLVSSPKGLIEVPRSLTKLKTVKGSRRRVLKISYEELFSDWPWREGPRLREEKYYSQDAERQRKEILPEPPPEPPPPPKPSKEIDSENGWISPEGKFYPCIYTGHIELCSRLGMDPQKAERRGWLKLQNGIAWNPYVDDENYSQAQLNILQPWYEKRGKPWWLKSQD